MEIHLPKGLEYDRTPVPLIESFYWRCDSVDSLNTTVMVSMLELLTSDSRASKYGAESTRKSIWLKKVE